MPPFNCSQREAACRFCRPPVESQLRRYATPGSSDRVRDLIGDLDELALSEVTVFVFGVAVVLEHLQDDLDRKSVV